MQLFNFHTFFISYNIMQIEGTVIHCLPARTGTSARGEWKAQDFVIETTDQFSRKMCFTVFGEDRLQRFNIQEGQYVSVSFDIEAREYQDVGSTASAPMMCARWFRDRILRLVPSHRQEVLSQPLPSSSSRPCSPLLPSSPPHRSSLPHRRVSRTTTCPSKPFPDSR